MASRDGLASDDLAETALADNVSKEFAASAAVSAEEACFVVIGLGRQVGVERGEIELSAIFLQRIVLEDAEGHVLVAIFLGARGGGFAEIQPLLQQALALGQNVQVIAVRLLQGLLEFVQFQPCRGLRANELFQSFDLLLDFIFGP